MLGYQVFLLVPCCCFFGLFMDLGKDQIFVFQIRMFRPSLVSVKDASSMSKLKEALAGMDTLPEIMVGDEGIVEVTYAHVP